MANKKDPSQDEIDVQNKETRDYNRKIYDDPDTDWDIWGAVLYLEGMLVSYFSSKKEYQKWRFVNIGTYEQVKLLPERYTLDIGIPLNMGPMDYLEVEMSNGGDE